MLKIIASFSKKVPAEQEYSSKSYFCTLEKEVPDAATPEQIHSAIRQTFCLVREAVETELNGGAAKAPIHVLPENPNGTVESVPKASNRQVKYVLDLAKQQGLGLSELNTRIQQTFGVPTVYHLDRKAASRLVDQLKAA